MPNPFGRQLVQDEPTESANPFGKDKESENPFGRQEPIEETTDLSAQGETGLALAPAPTSAKSTVGKKDPGIISSTGKGLMHGTQAMAESVGTIIQYAGGKFDSDYLRTLGKDTAEYWEHSKKKYEAPEVLQGSVFDNPGLMSKGSWWAYNVAGIVPTLAASIVPGVGTAKGITAFGKAVQWSPKVIEKLARIGGAVAGGTVGGGLEGANTYKEVLSKGGTEGEAETAAELMTLASGTLNTISVDKFLKGLPEGALSKLKARTVRGLTEGITEWLEGPAEAGIMYGGGHITVEEAIQKIKDELNVLGPAAVTGFFFPGAGQLPTQQQSKDKLKEEPATEPTSEEAPLDAVDVLGEVEVPDVKDADEVATQRTDDAPVEAGGTQDLTGATPGVGAPETAQDPGVKAEPIVSYFDPRLNRDTYRGRLEGMAEELVPGGGVSLIPDPDFIGGESDVRDEHGRPEAPLIRTPSLNPEWFQSLMEDDHYSMSVEKVQNAVQKANKGERLGVRQSRVVGGMLNHITDERTSGANMDYAREQLRIAREARAAAKMPDAQDWLLEEDQYPDDSDGISRTLLEFQAQAQGIGQKFADQVDGLLYSDMNDADIVSQITKLFEAHYGQQSEASGQALQELEGTAEVPGAEREPITREPAATEPAGIDAGDQFTGERELPVEEGLDGLPDAPAPVTTKPVEIGKKSVVEEDEDLPEVFKRQSGLADEDIEAREDIPQMLKKQSGVGVEHKKHPGKKKDLAGEVNEKAQAKKDASVKVKKEQVKKEEAAEKYAGEPDLLTGGELEPDLFEPAKKHPGKKVTPAEHITEEAEKAAASPENDKPAPTKEQIEAESYAKGHPVIQGLDIAIENPAGSKRKPQWPAMAAHYGDLVGYIGADGDAIDVFVKPDVDIADNNPVFIINQYVKGSFDEHKNMMGFANEAEARKAYSDSYTKGFDGLNSIHKLTITEFKKWLESGDTKAEYGKVEKKTQIKKEAKVPRETIKKPVIEKPATKKKSIKQKPKKPAVKKIDKSKIPVDLEITMEIDVIETGKTETESFNAKELIDTIDNNIDSYQMLKDCLG